MREVIFRGKDEKGKWWYGFLWKQGDDCFIRSVNPSGNLCDHQVDPETVGQFVIEKTDVTESKLFHGDVVTCVLDDYSGAHEYTGYVEYDEYDFCWIIMFDFGFSLPLSHEDILSIKATGETIHDEPKEEGNVDSK